MPKPSGLSGAQRRALFATVRGAARETGEDPEAYRRRIMREELGVEPLCQVSATTGFDRLMARTCSDAGDFVQAGNCRGGGLFRTRFPRLDFSNLDCFGRFRAFSGGGFSKNPRSGHRGHNLLNPCNWRFSGISAFLNHHSPSRD